ncbi:NAD(P)/FAD-dependent oxidoreductase [Bosea sp. BK604]|uniref:FAD/NAD(P)-dependent oxidoreductase n=1 Tax=Bosea sp. BK604 TaxID=2512180 RepID=UPI00104A5C00|nr:NAD(P)/FAD-dependent oxidoreductase [Bosea sp. BK604]TCR65312.1 thioredoxin reductase [Bosea sp. BK604]
MKQPGTVGALDERYDLAVIGAGPAGLSAAAEAAEAGLSVLLLDENGAPGGQIYRGISGMPAKRRAILGADFVRGDAVVERFERSAASYARHATVWSLAPDGPKGFEIGVSLAGAARHIHAREVVAATGAHERPFPIPGWTLPGVMTAGAAQIALKASALVPAGRVIVAGCGPLLFLVTAQLLAAGADIVAVLDTAERGNWRRALPHLPDFLRSPYLAKGLRLMLKARRAHFAAGVTTLRAEADADGNLSRIVYGQDGRETTLSCETLLLHQGVVPNINLANAVGCEQDWDEAGLCFVPRTDAWMQTSIPGLSIPGDGAGIRGAEAATLGGTLAALGALCRLGRLTAEERDRRATPIRAEFERYSAGRAFLDALYRPPKAFRVPEVAETIVCRCEEVTAGEIREAVAGGVTGPNQLKIFLRCGMGPCQGRQCSLTVTELIADARGSDAATVGSYHQRPPFKPVTLGELAALPTTPAAVKAVVR